MGNFHNLSIPFGDFIDKILQKIIIKLLKILL